VRNSLAILRSSRLDPLIELPRSIESAIDPLEDRFFVAAGRRAIRAPRDNEGCDNFDEVSSESGAESPSAVEGGTKDCSDGSGKWFDSLD